MSKYKYKKLLFTLFIVYNLHLFAIKKIFAKNIKKFFYFKNYYYLCIVKNKYILYE